MAGKVFLVGAGPGSPGLMTVKAKRCLELADAVVYDRLVSPRLLNLVRPDAQFVYVGKESGNHTMSQSKIQETLIELAQQGKKVVRLKGGDPFVYGRGGEEALALQEADIEWEVVPGVTSAVSVPAYAGIPLTHRQVATSFTVVTGHECVASGSGQVDWDEIGMQRGTLVILMGVEQLSLIVYRLLQAGRSIDTPIALVRWGTRALQQTLVGTLGDIVAKVKAAKFQAPAVIVVGEVVKLRESLAWFEDKPLFGQKVLVVTETSAEAEEEAEIAEADGAEVFDFALERQMKATPWVFADAISAIQGGAAVAVYFTSVLGVQSFFEALSMHGLDVRRLTRTLFGALNLKVANALAQAGIQTDYVGPSKVADVNAKTSISVPFLQWLFASQESNGQATPSRPKLLYELEPTVDNRIAKHTYNLLEHATTEFNVVATPFYQLNASAPALDALQRSWNLGAVHEVRVRSEAAYQLFRQLLQADSSTWADSRTPVVMAQ